MAVPLFLLFGGKLSASDIPFLAEILDRRLLDRRDNSEGVRCYLTVSRCFCGMRDLGAGMTGGGPIHGERWM